MRAEVNARGLKHTVIQCQAHTVALLTNLSQTEEDALPLGQRGGRETKKQKQKEEGQAQNKKCSSRHRLVGLVVRRPPRERKIPGSNPACAGIFRGRVIPVT